MWFVFIILVVVFICSQNGRILRENAANNARVDFDRRKTNSLLERRTMDGFLKEGIPLEEAFRLTQEAMTQQGFEPCVPIDAYKTQSGGCESHGWDLYFEYRHQDTNSKCVHDRIDAVLKKANENGELENISAADYILAHQDLVYMNFPETRWQYEVQRFIQTERRKVAKKGEYIGHLWHGTCEVLEVKFAGDSAGGHYAVRKLKTGEVIEIDIYDKRIVRL